MENVYRWDREDKLFAIEGLKQTEAAAKKRPLLQLVIDEDPVVRGKAALALKECGDPVLLRAADALLEQREPELSILALEILGFTRSVDFSDRVEPLLDAEDLRVQKSAIDTLHKLPEPVALGLLEKVIEDYEPSFHTTMKRLVQRWNHPGLLPLVKRWFSQAPPEERTDVLRTAAGLPGAGEQDWIRDALEEIDPPEEQRQVIQWLLTHSSTGS